jgi:hypothetical protein
VASQCLAFASVRCISAVPSKSFFFLRFFFSGRKQGDLGASEAGRSDKMNAPKIEERVFLLPDEDK